MNRFHLPVLFGLLLLAESSVTAQQSFKYNVEYKCGTERIVVKYCRNDNGQQVPPDQNYCQVEFPDRPRRVAEIAVFASMLRSEISSRLQSCSDPTAATGTGSSGSANSNAAAANQALSRGLVLMKAKDYSGAMVEFKEVLRLDPRHAIAFYQVGVAQYNLKEYTVANAAFERALQLNVANPHFVYTWIGDCQRALGQNEKAFSAYREAVRVKPDYAEGFNKMGLAYYAMKDYSNAVIFFDQAARLDPKTAAYRKNSGTAYVGAGKKDEAMKVYNALVPVDPKLAGELLDEITKGTTTAASKPRTPAETSFYKASEFYTAKDYQKALASFQEAMRLKPDYGEASHHLGMTHYQLKEYPQAIAAFENALKMKYANPHFSHLWIGDTYYEQKQYAKAITAYQEAIRLKPDYEQAFVRLGNSNYSLKQYTEAVAAFQAAIKIKPNDAVYHTSLGNSYSALKQYDKAVLSYGEAVRLDSKYDYALNMLGVSNYVLKEYPAALAAYERAVKLKPDNAIYQLNLGDTYVELGRKTDAIAVHNKLAVLDKEKAADLFGHIDLGPEPKTAEEFVKRGEKLLAKEKSFEALEAFIKAAQMKPDLFAAQKGLGAAYAARNLPTPSLSAYEKALALNANDPEIYCGLGNAKKGMVGRLDESVAAFQKCIELKPKTDVLADAHFALGELFLAARPKDAFTEFREVERLKPNYPKVQLYLAKAQYNDRQYIAALALFIEELKKKPDDAELVYYAGMCYVRLGKKPEAVAMYEKLEALGAVSAGNLSVWIKGMK